MPEGKPGKFSTVGRGINIGCYKRRTSTEGRTVCCCCELTAGSESVCHEALEEDGIEVRTTEVDGRCMACGTRADDNLHREHHERHTRALSHGGGTDHFRMHLLAFLRTGFGGKWF